MINFKSYIDAKKELTTQEKVGQLFMPAAFINDSEEEILQIEKLIKEECIGGLCFFHSRASAATNFEGKKQVLYNENSYERLKYLIARYQKVTEYPLLIAIDAEWGLAMRIENTPQYPYAVTLGALQNRLDLIFKVGQYIGLDCKKANIHWNLGPVVDINDNPDNPVIGYRSFGDKKEEVTEKAKAFLQGMQSVGVLNSLKHFPGHGDTAVDSHLDLPTIKKSKETLLDNELYPYQKLIKEDIDSIMVGHLSVPALGNGRNTSATVSKEIIQGILREELGFDGVVISDALNMHAVSKLYPKKGELEWNAFEAGNDMLCFAENPQEGIGFISEKSNQTKIEKSFERIWKLKEKVFFEKSPQILDTKNYSKLIKELAVESLSIFHGNENIIKEFRSDSVELLQIGNPKNNYFFEGLTKEIKSIKGENVLIALFPPKMKPKGNFGLSDLELDLLKNTLNSKNSILYIFGNPYVLNLFDFTKTKATLLVYQDFKAFQENATAHFMGTTSAKGKLPVKIKNGKNG
ncbi:hypothetical protein MTsPCn9_02080 [Croceitalea sp. MTPC9]|uniref:glycoside hydrolase family 3 protein n=1 Tax=unclassified Croceitalea TaxID=2632280 RepID=UPI002B3BB8E0|nr:hypothetical protein MTsPCn6_06630 [Croceitalea sp. MTPC6]GMN15272.1 hypothetical protein MTsPCn9_02080 [Croceitalea sp. MTPC9]